MKTKISILLLLALATCVFAASVVNSPHNLTVNGTGDVKAATEQNVCVFCHTPHHANGATPLWNHSMSSVSNYVVYGSARLTNMNIIVPQPNGSSRLCLSCHDGTVALGDVSSGAPAVAMQNSVTTMPAGANNLGTDLSQDHPVSLDYDACVAADNTLTPRASVDKRVKFETVGGISRVQCTSCHDPHDDQFGNFLVMDNSGSALCTSCHQPNQWSSSPHALSSTPAPHAIVARVFRKNSKTAKAAVASAPMSVLACENCHVNHQASSRSRLLQATALEQNCLNCHNGNTAKKNVAADFQKLSVHPITLNRDAHSSTEDPINPATRHVTCADCHDAHAANSTKAVAPTASGALANLVGVSAAGGVIKPLQKEYELCFRCHADSVARGPATVPRQYVETNTRLQFSPANQSFHPVETTGKNSTSVPSLVLPWRTTSVMYCTDCHNSDSGPRAGGTGADGPHGSAFKPLLERNLVTTDFQPESPASYALCYKCHNRSVVLSGVSFRFHESHVVKDQAACTTCHDLHGVANAPHLINFNSTYVTTNSVGQLNYFSTGTFKGTCNLTCHGKDHKNTGY
jgi:predicted CXXCH cytochrome family protein